MIYEAIIPPFRDHNLLSKSELLKYNLWFKQQLDERIWMLKNIVNATDRSVSWKADLSDESIKQLSVWLYHSAERVDRDPEEIEAVKAKMRFPDAVRSWNLSEMTYSICFDVGLYIANALAAKKQNAQWCFQVDDKNLANYGQPVLRISKGAYFNPITIARVTAEKMLSRNSGEDELYRVYCYWSDLP